MEHFLINSSVCLFNLWLVYKLLLENTSWHQFKRFYFLAAILVSAIVPIVVVRTVVVPLNYGPAPDFTTVELNSDTIVETGFTLDWSWILWGAYLIGVLIMGFRFLRNLYDLRIKTTDEVTNYATYKLILRELVQVPHSFFNSIYASKTDYHAGDIPDAVLQHEKAHLDQRHSVDILFIELLIVLFWFNPLLYLVKYSMKLNHEFLADQAVLSSGIPTKTYQETLLAYSSSSQHRALANTFNFPIIKKRFTIMKAHTTTASGLLRSLALIPVLAVLVISCGQEEIVLEPEVIEIVVDEDAQAPDRKLILIQSGEKEGTTTLFDGTKYSFKRSADGSIHFFDSQNQEWDFQSDGYKVEEITIVEVLENLTAADIKEYNQLAKKYKQKVRNATINYIINDETLRMQTIHNSMSSEQKKENEPYPFELILNKVKDSSPISPPPPPPTALQYIQENSNDLLFYIDSRRVSKNEAIKNIELLGQSGVEISPDANGQMAIKITMNEARLRNMPPPPPPAGPDSPTQEEQIANGTLKIYINDKIATKAQLDKLATLKQSDWKNISIYPKTVNGVRSTYFYGEGL